MENKLSNKQKSRLVNHGIKILRLLPSNYFQRAYRTHNNHKAAIHRATNISSNTISTMIADFHTWGLVEIQKAEQGSFEPIIITKKGQELLYYLLNLKDDAVDSEELERIVFGPTIGQNTRNQILNTIQNIELSKAGDCEAVADYIDNLLDIINEAESKNDDSWAYIPELNFFLINTVTKPSDDPQKSICLRILARTIGKTRGSNNWLVETRLITELGKLINKRDQTAIDAIHTLKEIKTIDDKIPDSVVNIIWGAALETIKHPRNNSFNDTNAAIEVLEDIVPYLSDNQIARLQKELLKVDNIQCDHSLSMINNPDIRRTNKISRLRRLIMQL